MANRLTNEWTKTAEGAFGATGARGLIGEKLVTQALRDMGCEVELYEDDYQMQVAGIDVEVRTCDGVFVYNADVKANMKSTGAFCVEIDSNGWLFNPKKTSQKIIHVNPTTGWMAIYDRKDMQEFVDKTKLWTFLDKWGKTLVTITPKMGGDFIQRIKL